MTADKSSGVQAFRSERVSTPEGIQPGAVLVRDEKIEGFVRFAEIPTGAEVHDFGQAAILPGLVDSHVHINDPGRAEWEGFETATRAAAAGGYTTLVDMPLNCLPATTTVAALDAKRTAAHGRSWVDWRAWGGVVSDNQAHVEALALAGVAGFKSFLIHPGIDGFTMVSESELRAALPHVARTGLPLLVHAELSGPVDEATRHLENQNANWNRYSTYLQSRPQEAELRAIRLLISLCREFEFRLHIVHLSAAKALPELCAARAEGLPITVETCPHYLHFCAEEIADGETLSKCAPPIRSRENREKLWQSLKDGIIDLVATDHSPCPPAMKQRASGNFKSAWGGISSLSMALPVMWTEASQRGFSLTDLTRWMASATAQLAGCLGRKGQIVEGADADFVIFEPEGEFVVSEDRLYHRHPTSPYAGKKLRGIVKATFLRGQLVFSKGEFCGKARGQELS